jgi:hypothetical protein
VKASCNLAHMNVTRTKKKKKKMLHGMLQVTFIALPNDGKKSSGCHHLGTLYMKLTIAVSLMLRFFMVWCLIKQWI